MGAIFNGVASMTTIKSGKSSSPHIATIKQEQVNG